MPYCYELSTPQHCNVCSFAMLWKSAHPLSFVRKILHCLIRHRILLWSLCLKILTTSLLRNAGSEQYIYEMKIIGLSIYFLPTNSGFQFYVLKLYLVFNSCCTMNKNLHQQSDFLSFLALTIHLSLSVSIRVINII